MTTARWPGTRSPHAAVLACLLAAGCGAPATGPAAPARVSRPFVPPPAPANEPAAPETAVLAKVAAALNGMAYMEGKIRFREYKDGREEHGTAKFSFRRSPFAARVDIEESNRALAAGTVVVWTGGSWLSIRRKGLPLTLSFPADHALVTSLRGWRLDQTDIFSMGKVLLAPGAAVRLAGPVLVDAGERLLLDVRSPASLPGITRERIGLDPATHVPTYREMYAGSTLVHRGIGERLVLNRPLDEGLFKL